MRDTVKSKLLMIKKFICFIFILQFFNSEVFSEELRYNGELTQGGLIRGKVEAGTEIFLDKKPIKISENGFFVFGFGRNHSPNSILIVKYISGSIQKNILKIKPRKWGTQKINNLPSKMVMPDKKSLIIIKENNKEILEARSIDSNETWFIQDFFWPVRGVVTGVYGTKRILNGKLRQPHYGIDIAAPKGTEVRAPANGRVSLAKTDHFYTGGTIILDHGHGLSSTYLHLNKLNVSFGQEVLKGEVIGFVGSTGRSTGDHLDWRINWLNVRIDPQLVVMDKL